MPVLDIQDVVEKLCPSRWEGSQGTKSQQCSLFESAFLGQLAQPTNTTYNDIHRGSTLVCLNLTSGYTEQLLLQKISCKVHLREEY